MTTTTTRERAYLQQLRKRRKLSQEQLAARLGVSRNTVGRMETGKGRTEITTVVHALAALNASPWNYCELVLNADFPVDQALLRQDMLDGLIAYLHGIGPLRTTMIRLMPPAYRALLADLGLSETLEGHGAISELSLLVALILLDLPRADIIAIVLAPGNHVVLARELAERRIASAPQPPAPPATTPRGPYQIPLLVSAVRRLQSIERRTTDLQPINLQVALAIAAINHYLSLHDATYAADPFAAAWDEPV